MKHFFWILFLLSFLSPFAVSAADLKFEFGPPQVIYDWSQETCNQKKDIPDAEARAFIDATGKVQVIAAGTYLFRNEGNNIDDTTRNCKVAFRSNPSSIPNPRLYQDYEWVNSYYTLDGQTIYALIHNEFHGWDYYDKCSIGSPGCWWNSITAAISRDAGVSYQHFQTPPNHLIASSPLEPHKQNGPDAIGYFQPSNIIHHTDGYYYVTLNTHNPPEPWHTCVMRTKNLNDPQSWRMWDGAGFNLKGDRSLCQPPKTGYAQIGHLSYNSYLGKYISISCHHGWTGGIGYMLSKDLINWEYGGVISVPNFPSVAGLYCSFIQPGDPTRNFEKSDRSPWVYYTACGNGAPYPQCPRPEGKYDDVDLARFRLRLTKPGDEGKYELLDLRFNEWQGRKTLDSSFYSNNAALNQDASLKRDGDKDTDRKYLHLKPIDTATVSHHSSLNAIGTITIEATIRSSLNLSSGQIAPIVKKEQDSGSKRNYLLAIGPGGVLHFSAGGKGTMSTKKVTDGAWHQVAAVYNDQTGQVTYYVDGQPDVQNSLGIKLSQSTNTAPLIIGGGLFQGDIDQITIYNFAKYTAKPGTNPTVKPTVKPTIKPTAIPTAKPTAKPTTLCFLCSSGRPLKSQGNANCDSKIDLSDFSAWQSTYQQLKTNSSPPDPGLMTALDFTCTSSSKTISLDLEDYLAWYKNYLN